MKSIAVLAVAVASVGVATTVNAIDAVEVEHATPAVELVAIAATVERLAPMPELYNCSSGMNIAYEYAWARCLSGLGRVQARATCKAPNGAVWTVNDPYPNYRLQYSYALCNDPIFGAGRLCGCHTQIVGFGYRLLNP